MSVTFSAYEAKARFSEILRRVRQGQRVVIAYRGEPVAELRPLVREPEELEAALRRLEAEGVVSPAKRRGQGFRPLARRPGALARFLSARD